MQCINIHVWYILHIAVDSGIIITCEHWVCTPLFAVSCKQRQSQTARPTRQLQLLDSLTFPGLDELIWTH